MAVIIGVVLLGILVAGLAVFSLQDDKRVMVLMPLDVESAALGGIAEGLSDGLHNLISAGQGVQLVARSWSFAVRDPDVGAKGIAEQFDADFLLEGALSQPALQYELSLELVNAQSGASLWRQRFSAADAQALSSKVMSGVREALNERADARIARLPQARAPLNEEAYRAYLQARHHWSLRGGDHFGRASELLHRSIELDPDFAAARLALAQVAAVEPFYTAKPIVAQFTEARAHLEAALQADPSLRSQVQALEGFMQSSTRNWQQALELLQSALATDPNNALAHHWQSMFLGAVGDYRGALTHAQRAVELEPATPVFRDRLGIAHMWLNDLQAAEREFVRAEQLGFALDFRSKAFVLFLVRSGRFDELRRLLLHRRLPQDWVTVFVDALETGNPELHAAAVEASDAAIAARAIPRELHFGVWVALQEPERAVAAFDLSYKTDDEEFLWAPECEFLAQAPGYEALLSDLGLDEASRKELAKQRDRQP
jgi:TolB-like protein